MAVDPTARAVTGHVYVLRALAAVLLGGATVLLIWGSNAGFAGGAPVAATLGPVLVIAGIPFLAGVLILLSASRLARGPSAFSRNELSAPEGLIIVGAIMLALFGGCSGLFWLSMIDSLRHGVADDYGFFGMSLYVGGIPTAIAIAVLVNGLARKRLRRVVREAPAEPTSNG